MVELIKEIREIEKQVLIEFFKPSTIFAFMVYATFVYLSIFGKISANVVENAFLILMAFYYGKKSGESNGGPK